MFVLKSLYLVHEALAFAESGIDWQPYPQFSAYGVKQNELAEENLSSYKVRWLMFGLQNVADMGTLMCNL